VLVQACVRCGLTDEALRHAIAMVQRVSGLEAQASDSWLTLAQSTAASGPLTGKAGSTWLPYSTLDALLSHAEDPASRPSHGSTSATATRELASALRAALRARLDALGRRERETRRDHGRDEAARQRRRERESGEMQWAPPNLTAA
jgi:hypothetical protein